MTRKRTATDRDRYQILRQMLVERRTEIQDKLRSLRETLPETNLQVRDAEEQSVDDFVQHMDFALMEMKSETLQRIDAALQRLDGGTYGVCGECGTEISEARLRALPFAILCRQCQEEEESRSLEDRENKVTERAILESPARE
jgi:DnaK suppressor protein